MNNVSPINENIPAAPDQQSGQSSNAPTGEQKLSASTSAPDDLSGLYDAKVMMVDDEPLNLEVTQIYLEAAGYSRFVSTDDPMKAVALIASERPDVLLLDIKMPGKSGFEIIGEMKQKNMLQDVPTIVLTASSDAETKLQALELGATDFLAKPVDPSELVLRMRNTLAAKAYRDRLANYDRLTGLPNRRTFIEQLEWALDFAPRRDKPGSVLLIDLDGFKQINDALGPALGDELLQVVAGRIATVLRVVDILNRFQTDEARPSLSRMASERPDVLLLDIKMPGKSGFEIIGEMKQKNMLQDVPTIVLTASSDAETKLQALELGATDFLAKPVDPSELVLRMRNTLAAKAYRDRLANYDRLTGLPNRRTFIEQLEWALDFAPRRDKPGSVLLIDLDGFKQINDALGPALGDELLQVVAGRIATVLRVVDILNRFQTDEARPSLSRMASDEFAMLLPVMARADSAAQVAQRVLEAIASPFSLGGQELRITCGIGIAVFPDDGMDTDSIVRNASVAMHHSKRQKKHSYQFYSHELNARAVHRLNLGNQLRKAIERNELHLVYQPKNDIQTGKVCGCEALVRWQHPEHGVVGPDEFIELAEETGLINSFGEWVIRAACKQSKAWQSAGLSAPRISVNVSSHQFLETRLPDALRRILHQTGADPASLIIEITEGMLMKNADANVEVLKELKTMGIKLSMDDFGTGYSSLSYLSSFPLDELKIDRSFMARIQQAGERSAIVAAIIAMAHSMEMNVVAEGVENEHQLQFLKMHGCDEYQGFMVSKPVLPEEFAARFLSVPAQQGMSSEVSE